MPHAGSDTGLSPSVVLLSRRLSSLHGVQRRGPTTPHMPEGHERFGLFPGRSPLLGESLNYFLFLEVLRCFSSLR